MKYVSNRKNGYKVLKTFKRSNKVKLLSKYGTEFFTTTDTLEANGYKFVTSKPSSMRR